jgi:biopolymer transport protein ExbB
MIDFFTKGGVIVYIILAVSMIGTFVFFKKFFEIRAIKKNFEINVKEYKMLIASKRLLRLKQHSLKSKDPLSSVISKSLNSLTSNNFETFKSILPQILDEEVDKLYSGVEAISLSANSSPLLGLLGTITGLIKIFKVVGRGSGSSYYSKLSIGIMEALYTTIAGLAAALLLNVLYWFIVRYIEKFSSYFKDEVYILINSMGDLDEKQA